MCLRVALALVMEPFGWDRRRNQDETLFLTLLGFPGRCKFAAAFLGLAGSGLVYWQGYASWAWYRR